MAVAVAALDREGDGSGPVSLYEGGSIEELRLIVSDRLSPHRLTVLGDQLAPGRFRAFHEGRVALYDLAYGAPVRLWTGEIPDFYSVILPQAGHGRVTVNGTGLLSPPFVAGPGDEVGMEWDGLAVNAALAMSRETLDEALAVRLGDVPRHPLRFRQHALDPADPAVHSWLALAHAFREFVVSPLGRRSRLGVEQFERLLADTLLDVHPLDRSRTVGHDGALLPSALRRATAYCAEHADEAVTASDIAGAARVSLRTLRDGFRRHLDTTPLAYLRRVRLDRAHQDLTAVAAGDATGTVTDVACRWGFTHLGRFSAEYRRAYGRLPSETLRGRR
ncbi:AraC family transcriptional regulator [Kitasatospora sp. NPDC101176]|uniref:AraC family transcriptional regulator n=1 Tax=Kitasatospora sp. NPDC101176 TaxID=3364099 RepID=UPI00382A9DAF